MNRVPADPDAWIVDLSTEGGGDARWDPCLPFRPGVGGDDPLGKREANIGSLRKCWPDPGAALTAQGPARGLQGRAVPRPLGTPAVG